MADTIRVRGSLEELPSEAQERDADLAFEHGLEIETKHFVDVSPQGREAGELGG